MSAKGLNLLHQLSPSMVNKNKLNQKQVYAKRLLAERLKAMGEVKNK